MDHTAQMAARYRRHLLTVFGGALVGGLAIIGGYSLIEVLFVAARPPAWLVFLPMLGIPLIAMIGAWSTFTNLRCPACGGGVAMQTARNYSLFGARAKKTCDRCGGRIFGSDGTFPRVR